MAHREIQIELRHGPLQFNVCLPTAAAQDCQAWLRECPRACPSHRINQHWLCTTPMESAPASNGRMAEWPMSCVA